jgi:acetyl-CoA synthetase
MLHAASSYTALRESFAWDIPKQYNMGVDVCDKWALKEPDRTAIIDLSGEARRDVSFDELQRLSNQLATHLKSLGVVSGDRIGVLRSQSVWTAAAHIAIWKLGAISMPLFSLFRSEALYSRLENSGARVVIVDESSIDLVNQLRSSLPELRDVTCPEMIAFDDQIVNFEPYKTLADDPALLIYTSGTTGPPKGALLAHRTLLGHLPGVEMSHDFLPQNDDCLWTPADWAWIGGLLDVLMPGLHHGVPVVAARMRKFSVNGCQKIISDGGVRNVFFPPTALKILMEEDGKISGLRSVASGGEPLGAALLDWGKEALGVTINEFYGQTECNMVVSSCNALFASQEGCAGRPVPGQDITIIDKNGEPTLNEGDVAIRRGTPVMMLKYWNNPEETQEKFRGDWLLTGDRGVLANGYIRFVGREDDVITSAGYRIGPSSIENCLLGHPLVVGAAVVGKPDTKRTEIVKAYVKLREGIVETADLIKTLQTYVADNLAAHEYPREIAFVDEFPMTVTGKIIRKDLKARACAELES